MASNEEGQRFAPYCPPATLLQVLKTYRKRDVPETLDKDLLVQIGVPEALTNRTWQALAFLGLVEPEGVTTKDFRALRYANDEEYPGAFRKILEKAYAQIFSVIDPATASDVQLNNAFHPYSPLGQRSRMVTLFLGLCQEAGIPVAVQTRSRSTQAEASTRRGPSAPRRPTSAATLPPRPGKVGRRPSFPTGADAALFAWFNTRPPVGAEWAKPDRARWNAALMAILDSLYIDLKDQAAFDRIVEEVNTEADEEEIERVREPKD